MSLGFCQPEHVWAAWCSQLSGNADLVDLDEIGIDVHRHHAKTFDDVDPSSFDLIVTLSPEAHHRALTALKRRREGVTSKK